MLKRSQCFVRNELGSTAVVFAFAAIGMIGLTALALTGGQAYSVRQKAQNALDSAVLAGAALPYGSIDEDRISAAQATYKPNQPGGTTSQTSFAIDELPAAMFTVSDSKVYGTTTVELKAPFLKVFGKTAMSIPASSAAHKRRGDPACLIGLDPTEEATMDFNGQASVEVKDCASQANSSSGSGMRQVGQPTMKAKAIGVTGGYTGSEYEPVPITGTSPIPDPLASLPEPSSGACHALSGQFIQNATMTLSPGTFCDGLNIKAGSVIVLEPGEYIFKDGPLTIDSNSTVTGNNVFLAFLGPTSTLYLIGGGSLKVTSPSSGTYKNVQFFGDRETYAGPNGKPTSLWFTVIGTSQLIYDGTLYAPSFHVWWAGGSLIEGKSPNYIAIAKKLWFQDKTKVRLSYENTRNLDVPQAEGIQFGASLFR